MRNIADVTTAVAKGDLSQQDHRRRARRDPRAEEHDQHHGRPARRPSPTRSPASPREVGTEGNARRPGRGQGRRPAPGRTSPTTSTRWPATSPSQVRNIADVTTAVATGDLSQEDHGRRQGRGPRAQEHDQHDGRPALVASRTRSRASPARWAPKARLGGQAKVKGVRARWKDLTDNVNAHGRQPHRPGAEHRRRHDRGRDRRPEQEDHRRRHAARCSSSRRRSTRWSISCARSPPR